MGKCFAKPVIGDVGRQFIPPPVSKLSMTSNEVRKVVREYVGDAHAIIWDAIYDTIEKEDVQRFLSTNINTEYIIERSDCDDFSIHLCSRFREHAYNMNTVGEKKGGPLFGIMTGDLRFKETDPPRYHAVCFFIDSEKKFYIVDGMYNEIVNLAPSMKVGEIIV